MKMLELINENELELIKRIETWENTASDIIGAFKKIEQSECSENAWEDIQNAIEDLSSLMPKR